MLMGFLLSFSQRIKRPAEEKDYRQLKGARAGIAAFRRKALSREPIGHPLMSTAFL
jgi:hypothetical protein